MSHLPSGVTRSPLYSSKFLVSYCTESRTRGQNSDVSETPISRFVPTGQDNDPTREEFTGTDSPIHPDLGSGTTNDSGRRPGPYMGRVELLHASWIVERTGIPSPTDTPKLRKKDAPRLPPGTSLRTFRTQERDSTPLTGGSRYVQEGPDSTWFQ